MPAAKENMELLPLKEQLKLKVSRILYPILWEVILKFTQNGNVLIIYSPLMLMESQVFHSPQNISGASVQNSLSAFF